MPIVKLIDGTNIFVDSNDPAVIAEAKQKAQKQKTKRLKKRGSGSVVGDIGRGIAAGVVSIPQGIATIPTTGLDLLFNTDVTDDVNEFFEDIKPDVQGTAGKTAQMVAQFGIPGLGVASALSKMTKLQQLGTLAAVDAAVATDDVDTFADMLFDKESDEERLRNLQGRDAALARLTERLQVLGETAAVMYAAPVAVSGAVKGIGAGLDLAAPYMNAIAKATPKFGDGTAALASANKADKGVVDYLKKYFTYGGKYEQTAANNKYIMDAMQAKSFYLASLVNPINDSMNAVRRTLEDAVSVGGKMNSQDALEITKAMSTYRAPLLKVEREFPNLTGKEKKAKMVEYQREAMKKIKSFEGSGNKIDYDALGVSKGNEISKIMENNQNMFKLEQQAIFDFSDPDATISRLLIPKELREAIGENAGLYGTTVYRSIVDKSFRVNPELRKKAVDELLTKVDGIRTPQQANDAFELLTNPRSADTPYQTPELFVEGIKFGQLQGKDLKNLPAVRKAMGEITALDYNKAGDWKLALQDEAVAASSTMSKLGGLSGRAKTFDDIRTLNSASIEANKTGFLKNPEEIFVNTRGEPDLPLGANNKVKLPDETTIDGVLYKRFKKDAGALRNTYAPKVFHDSLMETTTDWLANSPVPLKKIYQGLLGLKALSQYGKTILGPTAQIRNNTSVPFMALMNGNLGPSGRFTDNFKMAFSGIFDPRKKAQYAKEIAEAREYGVMVGKGTQLQELSDIATFATDDVAVLAKAKSQAVFDVMRKPLSKAEGVYTGSDNAARMINFSGEKSKLAKVLNKSSDADFIPVSSGRNMADPDIQKLIKADGTVNVGELRKAVPIKKGDNILDKFIKGESADISLNVTPTYSRVPEIVKSLNYVPVVGNFTAFPAEVIRNSLNTLQRAVKEIASSNPELQKVGARRLAGGLTTTVGIPAGLTATALTLTGADKEQLDAYKRSFAAPWEKTATMIPTGTDARGNITGLYNFSYTNPYDYLQKPFKAVMNAYANGERNEAGLMDIATNASVDMVGEFVNPFLSPSMGAKALYESTLVGKTETGKTIYNESDMLGEKMAKGTLHFFNAVAPTITPIRAEIDADGVQIVPKDFITAAASIATGKKGLISPRGKPIDVAETMVSAFSGIKVIKPQIDRSLYYKAAEAKRAIRETTNEFNRLLRSNNRRDAEDFIQGYINTNEDRYNSLRTLYTAIEDARTLGLKEFEIDEQLKIAKVANRDMVMLGMFNPIEPNEDVIDFAMLGTERKAAQPVPIGDLVSSQIDLTGQSLRGQFQDPQNKPVAPPVRRAADVLREEEINKILGTP
tara:strand:- start:1458 stop:5408 length:3951 start_codon:yes stop_codon:yes gene_type:complete